MDVKVGSQVMNSVKIKMKYYSVQIFEYKTIQFPVAQSPGAELDGVASSMEETDIGTAQTECPNQSLELGEASIQQGRCVWPEVKVNFSYISEDIIHDIFYKYVPHDDPNRITFSTMSFNCHRLFTYPYKGLSFYHSGIMEHSRLELTWRISVSR